MNNDRQSASSTFRLFSGTPARALAFSLGVALPTAAIAGPAAAAPAAAPTATVSLRATPLHHEGVALSAGGGVTAYTDSRAREALGTGAYWEVRGLLGARSFIGNEVAYVGSSRAIRGAAFEGGHGSGDSGRLLGNGVEVAARLNLPLQLASVGVAPFVFVGPGFSHLSVVGGDGVPSGMKTSDTVLVLTSGAGLAVTHHKVVLGARFTHREAYGADVIRVGGENANLRSWSLALTVGHEL